MLIGDGKLNYGLEQIAEAYYRIQVDPYVQITQDFQSIQNPGYNKDRGAGFCLFGAFTPKLLTQYRQAPFEKARNGELRAFFYADAISKCRMFF